MFKTFVCLALSLSVNGHPTSNNVGVSNDESTKSLSDISREFAQMELNDEFGYLKKAMNMKVEPLSDLEKWEKGLQHRVTEAMKNQTLLENDVEKQLSGIKGNFKSPTSSAYAGASSTGLSLVSKLAVKITEKKLSELVIPDVNTVSLGFNISITNIKCPGLNLGEPDISVGSRSVTIETHKVHLQCGLKWSFQRTVWPHFPYGSGELSAYVRRADVSVGLYANNAGPSGSVALHLEKCKAGLDFSVSFGSSKWDLLINGVKGFVSHYISTNFQKILCGQLKDQLIKKFNENSLKLLKLFNIALPVFDQSVSIQLKPKNFEYKNNALFEIGIDGGLLIEKPALNDFDFIPHIKPVELRPSLFLPLSNDVGSPYHFVASVDIKFLLENLFDTFAEKDFLNFILDGNHLNNTQNKAMHFDLPIKPNTKMLEFVFPSIYEMYPDDDLQIGIKLNRGINAELDDADQTIKLTLYNIDISVNIIENTTAPLINQTILDDDDVININSTKHDINITTGFIFTLSPMIKLQKELQTDYQTDLDNALFKGLKVVDMSIYSKLKYSNIGADLDISTIEEAGKIVSNIGTNFLNDFFAKQATPKVNVMDCTFGPSHFSVYGGDISLAVNYFP